MVRSAVFSNLIPYYRGAALLHCFKLSVLIGLAWWAWAGITVVSPVQASGCPGTTAITSNTTWSTNQCLGDVTVTNGATLTIAGNTTHDLVSLTLGNGVTNGFIVAQGDTVNGTGVILNVDANVHVYASSKIGADGQGYVALNGPGAGSSYQGAGYGGMGGNTSGGDTYGSVLEPVNLGSGGGYSGNNYGGGAIKMNIAGNLTNNGTISANGTANYANFGGGSGGSVWIHFTGGTSAWSGSGVIAAEGATVSTGTIVGSGGGGRVAVTGYVSSDYTGAVQAYSGNGYSTARGAAGTVYLKSTSQSNGALKIDNNAMVVSSGRYSKSNVANLTLDSLLVQNRGTYLIPAGATVSMADGVAVAGTANSTIDNQGSFQNLSTVGGPVITNTGTVTTAAVSSLSTTLIQRGTFNQPGTAFTIASGGILTADAPTVVGDTTVQSGGTMNHSDNSTAETYKLDLTVQNLTVENGGAVTVSGLGYDSGNGPGAGGASSGGGHGGMGGGGSGGDTYGSATTPVTFGSGGSGGAGGGAIKLTVSGNLINNGTISANGVSTTYGGAGGSIWIAFPAAGTWTGSGSITASSGTSSSRGAGGRVSITGFSGEVPANPTAYNVTAGLGSNGTVFLKSSTQTSGALLISNNGVAPAADKYAKTNIADLSLDSLTVQNNGMLEIPTGSTITLADT
jgi:hypothetical protein